MLEVNRVTKKYGKFTALENVSLQFEKGVYGLLAPNGAGKTTLIKMLSTLLFPTNGEILWQGNDIYKMDERYRDILGYLPQQFGYYKNYTARQYLRYLAVLKNLETKAVEHRIDELLEIVMLKDDADKKMRKYSGGMIQRVGIAQAMLNNPQILILDEPTSGLDPKERVRFRNVINALAADRIVILSTHIVSDIETIANQVIMIQDHKIYCCLPPSEICKNLAGKVYEVPNITAVDMPHLFLGERQSEAGTMYRMVCKNAPPSAKRVVPTLEDVFLYVFQDKR